VSARTTIRAGTVAILAAAWAVCSYLLWQSKVPSSLALPRLDPHAYFTSGQLAAAADFSRLETLLFWGTTIAQLVVFGLYARYGDRWAGESAAGPIGTGMLLGMLGFALVWVVQLPFGAVDLWWQRRHHISHVGYGTFLFGNWGALAGEFVFLCFALLVVMGLARFVGDAWWLPAAPVFVGLALLFTFVSPYLTDTKPLRDPELSAAAARLERIEHVGHVPIRVEQVQDATSLPNAEAVGLGPSRRVLVWDTMLSGRFTEPELRVVIAHELGHQARKHLWKSIAWFALFAFPGTFLLSRFARLRGGMRDPEAVPLALLVLVVLNLLALPLQNAISRHMEAEADWLALRATHDPASARALFTRFVPTTLDEPSPDTFDYLMLENHPTIMQRLAMAQAWRTTYRSRSGG
jgi:STE24 endopeptidase